MTTFTERVSACSIYASPTPYEKDVELLKRPVFSELVKSATFIDLAIVTSSHKSPTKLKGQIYDYNATYGTRYNFESLESLKGGGDKTFFYIAPNEDNNFVAEPLYNADGVIPSTLGFQVRYNQHLAELRHRHPLFWNTGEINIGEPSTYGSCRTYVEFELGTRYLVLRDLQGAFLSAEQIDFSDDIWLIAVRNLVQDPTKDYGYSIDLKNYIRMQAQPSIIEIKSCRNLSLTITNIRKKTTTVKKPQRYIFDGIDDFINFPFDKKSCRVGTKYFTTYSYDSSQWFKVDSFGIINFTDIAGQLKIKDPQKLPLTTLYDWLSTE
ncbi:MAG: hypothetical protein DHS20C05_18890 [Hyphococcus sp.]|nr:MAG: hypothetical protein DHS20C05_18890 [Marinicaulis sp.]